jgi:DNA-binding winged helix-turn-helix (wHTH) protein/TolB-like protein/Tfp pilus assembly protein PilF
MEEARPEIYEFDKFRLDVAKRLLASHDGSQIPLKPRVFDTLLYLVRHCGKLIEKDELMREIWSDSIVEENNLNQNISVLRRVLGEKPGEQRFIVTVPGRGYRFVADVRQVSDADLVTKENTVEEDLRGGGHSATEGRIAVDPSSTTRGEPDVRYSKLDIVHPKWVVPLAFLSVFAFAATGFFIWREIDPPLGSPITTVAILPFKPLVLENRNEALELGMADALIAKLSGEDVAVQPLSAIRRYSALEQDALAAGRELGTEAVLDGTIQNWGDRVRISAKLLRSRDGKQLWAGQFDEKFTDIFEVQDAISERVATALKVRLAGKRHATENIEAYQLYMRGRYNFSKGTPADLIASIPFFEEAIKADPQYALAYTGLAGAYGVLGLSGDMTQPDTLAKAWTAERKALQLDDTLGEAHIANCMGTFWYDWDWHSAEMACLKAIEIDPNNADFHGHYAMVLSNTGRHAEALAEAKRSRELDPLNLMQIALEGQFLLHAGRVDEALERLKKTSELEPNFWMPHYIAASAYIEKGMYAEAIAESRREYELSGGNVIPFGVYALVRSGKLNDARAALKQLLDASETKYVSPYNIALIYSALDERENAIKWLEKAYELRDPKMTFLKVEPKWNSLRGDPRFADLISRMNL